MRKEIIVEDFSGGIANDIREQSSKGFAISQHFDNTTSPKKLVPFRDSQDDNTTQVGIMNFTWDGNYVYGLGLTLSGGLKTKIYRKTTIGDLTSDWLAVGNGESSNSTHPIANSFIMYKDVLYMNRYTNGLDTYTPGSTTYSNSAYALTNATSFTDGSAPRSNFLIHPINDTLFLGFNNYIWKNDGVNTPSVALTLPSNLYVSSIAELGSYLAIGCRPKNGSSAIDSGAGSSKMFLWDMIQADVSQVIDFGVGDLWILANVGGALVAVMSEPTSAGVTFPTKKVFIKVYAGGTVSTFKTLEDTDLEIGGLLSHKPFYSTIDGLTFSLMSSGTRVPTGLYSFTRGADGNYQVTSSRLIHNNTTITNVVGIYKVGQVVFTAYNYVADTSTQVGRTEESEIYNNTAFVETVKYNCGSINKNKRFVGISVSHEPLTSGQTVTVKYRKDSQTSYTTIGSNSEVDSVFKEYITEGTVGKNLPEFHEIQFRIESTGGAVITGWRKVYEEKDLLLDNK